MTFCSQAIKTLINSLPNNKILDVTRLKGFADGKINVAEKVELVLGKVENVVEKQENACNQLFLYFPQCFLEALISQSEHEVEKRRILGA